MIEEFDNSPPEYEAFLEGAEALDPDGENGYASSSSEERGDQHPSYQGRKPLARNIRRRVHSVACQLIASSPQNPS